MYSMFIKNNHCLGLECDLRRRILVHKTNQSLTILIVALDEKSIAFLFFLTLKRAGFFVTSKGRGGADLPPLWFLY